ncbi:MAG: xanthine dehydrogenase family protein molybdopterin-binding subunit [Acidimicrobiia bacterium]
MSTKLFGKAVKRKEDPALIMGTGRFVDDIKLTAEVSASFVRSPFAHARVTSIDASEALAMPGVHAVYTIDDVRHLGPLLAQAPIGKLRPLLADGVCKHVGEAVAMVIADDRYLAKDAADAVRVEYEPLKAIVDLEEAASDEAKVHDDLASNTVHTWEVGEAATIEEAKSRPDVVVVSQKMTNQRLIPTAIEPRGVLAEWTSGYGSVTVWSTTQQPHAVAGAIALTFGVPYNKVRVVAPEVGGGFGRGLNVYAEDILACFASKQLGRPVRWIETRREAATATVHGRGWVATGTIVATLDGKLIAYELAGFADMGAYSQNFTVAIPVLGQFTMPGQYKWEAIHWKIACVVTNTPTTDAYRGAGRPEVTFYVERMMDLVAIKLGMDPVELRKKNFWQPDEFPASTLVGMTMDSGNYGANVDRLMQLVDIEALRTEQEQARAQGRYLGIGIGTFIEACGLAPSGFADAGLSWAGYGLPAAFNESAVVRVTPDGSATVIAGTGPTGQGHETTFAQIISDTLGISFDRIEVRHGDTRDAPMGIGTGGSRSAAVGGAAVAVAAGRVQEKAAKIAAHMMEAAPGDIRFEEGGAHVAGSPEKKVSWQEIAATAYQPHKSGMESGLDETAFFDPLNLTWPFGSHLAVVEVDPETGDVKLLSYTALDDCGNVINPMIVDGQIHGGIAQGVGQALFEEAVFDENGNLLTTSLADYLIPTATDLPSFVMGKTVTPTNSNPLGVKGIGEAGTIASTPVIVNAVVDALKLFGVTHIEMPLRPKRVWQAIQDAKGA